MIIDSLESHSIFLDIYTRHHQNSTRMCKKQSPLTVFSKHWNNLFARMRAIYYYLVPGS
jgi:hypothetical protein